MSKIHQEGVVRSKELSDLFLEMVEKFTLLDQLKPGPERDELEISILSGAYGHIYNRMTPFRDVCNDIQSKAHSRKVEKEQAADRERNQQEKSKRFEEMSARLEAAIGGDVVAKTEVLAMIKRALY